MNKKSYEKVVSIDTWNKMVDDLYYIDLDIEIVYGTTVKFTFSGVTYYCSLLGDKAKTGNVGNIMTQFNKYIEPYSYCVPDGLFGKVTTKLDKYKTKVNWDIKDPGNYSFTNDNYSRQWLECYCYDANSAYSYAMCQDMPDTNKEPRLNCILKKGEIGFYLNGYATLDEGAYVDYAFPLMKSPFIPYVERYYKKKQEATTKEERKNWKAFLNIVTGMMHKKNIFMRNAILFYAAQYIQKYIDEDTVYCNTDSIVSLRPRYDLPIGTELGQFKQEHIGQKFKFIQAGIYQWDNECHYKGVPGVTITDIENAKGWKNNLPYRLENRRIIKNGEKD